MSERQKIFYAIVVSALFHALAAFVLGFWAVDHAREVAAALPDLGQLEVTLMPARRASAATAPPVAAAATPRPSHIIREVMDSDGLTPSKVAPKQALFESDVNMVAGSQEAPLGSLPLPSQQGHPRSFIGFKDQQSTFGNGISPRDAPVARPTAQAPSEPVAGQDKSTPAPQPTAAAKAADEAGYAMGKAVPTPQPTPVQVARLDPSLLRGHADMKSMEMTKPEPHRDVQPEPGMAQEIDKTRVNGGITKRGQPGVDAVESPFGKYHKEIGTLIGSRWNHYVKNEPDLIAVGDVTILIKIAPSGRVMQTRVTSNNANDGLAALSIKAIMDCKLPPLPDDLAPMLRDGNLEIPYTFTVYDPN